MRVLTTARSASDDLCPYTKYLSVWVSLRYTLWPRPPSFVFIIIISQNASFPHASFSIVNCILRWILSRWSETREDMWVKYTFPMKSYIMYFLSVYWTRYYIRNTGRNRSWNPYKYEQSLQNYTQVVFAITEDQFAITWPYFLTN